MKKPIITWLGYIPFIAMALNDWYAEIIEEKELSINNFLEEYGLKIHKITFTECAPCQVEYTVNPISQVGVGSYTFFKMVQQAKEHRSVEVLVNECNRLDAKYRQKQKRKCEL